MTTKSNKHNESLIDPYIRLLRLNHPTGFFLLMWPSMWALAFASGSTIRLDLFAIFFIGSFLMRSAGCIINDIVDRKFDGRVARTTLRPIASGEIKLYQAFLVLAVILFLAFGLLLFLNTATQILGLLAIIPVIIYPFMKRITYWPQLFLAFTFNLSVLMAWTATTGTLSFQAFILYAASFLWTVGYDTIYAHQDKEDDAKLGLKSSALRLGDNTKKFLWLLYGSTLFFLWFCGVLSQVNFGFYALMMVAVCQMFWQIIHVDLNNPDHCMRIFKSNRWFGLIVFLAIIAGKTI